MSEVKISLKYSDYSVPIYVPEQIYFFKIIYNLS